MSPDFNKCCNPTRRSDIGVIVKKEAASRKHTQFKAIRGLLLSLLTPTKNWGKDGVPWGWLSSYRTAKKTSRVSGSWKKGICSLKKQAIITCFLWLE